MAAFVEATEAARIAQKSLFYIQVVDVPQNMLASEISDIPKLFPLRLGRHMARPAWSSGAFPCRHAEGKRLEAFSFCQATYLQESMVKLLSVNVSVGH